MLWKCNYKKAAVAIVDGILVGIYRAKLVRAYSGLNTKCWKFKE